MTITVEDVSPTRKRLVATVTAAEIQAEEKSVMGEYAKAARLPGFRPGKAPAEMVKRRYAKEIGEELKRKVVGKAYEEATKNTTLQIFTVVNVESAELTAGQDAAVKIIVDVHPQFELPAYKEVPVFAVPTAVTDADVDGAITSLREQRADYAVVERAAAAGDFVKLNYTGSLDGKAIAEIAPDKTIYGTQHGTWEEAGAKEGPGVRAVVDGILGMKVGDKKDATQEFAADFEVPELAGKKATYALEVLEVREKKAAPLDEAFLKSLQCTSEEELRTKVRKDLQTNKEQQARASSREQVVKVLTGAVDFPLPESAVENETQELLRGYIERHMQQGVPEAEFEKRKDELYKGAKEAATGRVKLTLILLKIAEQEKLKVENDDLHQRIMQEAVMSKRRPEQIVKLLQEDRQLLAQMQRAILHTKTLDFVVGQAKLTTQPAA